MLSVIFSRAFWWDSFGAPFLCKLLLPLLLFCFLRARYSFFGCGGNEFARSNRECARIIREKEAALAIPSRRPCRRDPTESPERRVRAIRGATTSRVLPFLPSM